MISITPQSQIYLCRTPLENDYKHQLTFNSYNAQETYFNSRVYRSASDYTYIKKDNAINVNFPIDDIITCNYLFYKNTGFDSKYYYCFITNMEYVNENCTRIFIETDVYQTYMFDIVRNRCFIEREHVGDDTIGAHTIDEGLATGEFIINSSDLVTNKFGTGKYIVAVNKFIPGMGEMPDDRTYGNLFSGECYIYFRNTSNISALIKAYAGYGAADGIINIFSIPGGIITEPNPFPSYTIPSYGYGDVTIGMYILPQTPSAFEVETGKTISINSSLNGYVPKNNKMFCFPFNYLSITNNAGTDVVYKYEEFTSHTPKFNLDAVITPGCSVKLYPVNYKRYNDQRSPTRPHWYPKEFNCGITGAKFPNCSWTYDGYINWLTQNAVNKEMQDIQRDLSIFGGLADLGMGNVEGALSGLGSIVKSIQAGKASEFIPNQTRGNVNAGDVAYSTNNMGFTYFKMSVKYEYAKMCDDFFSMYGYKVNSVKLPNITGRRNWNYVKTVDCNFEGNIPQVYLDKIKQIFNRGITFWHNPSTFLDYTQNNDIL